MNISVRTRLTGCLLSTGDVLIGTILDGITLLDSGGIPKWHLNSANGMQNNTVLGLFSDREGNIWSALDHGIDYVAADRAKGIHFFSPDGLGAVYDAAFSKDGCTWAPTRGFMKAGLVIFPVLSPLCRGPRGRYGTCRSSATT